MLLEKLLANLSPLTIVGLPLTFYVAWRIIAKVCAEIYLTHRFNKLPKYSHVGAISWLVGNLDLYYYAMSHMRMENAMLQIISSVLALDDLFKKGFFRFTLGYLRMIAFYSADTVETLVTSVNNITKGHQYEYFKPWLGLGLLTSTGEHWRRHRKLLTPAFHFKILETFLPTINKNVQMMITRIEKKHTFPMEFDIRPPLGELTMDTICETAMGTTVGAQTDTVDHDQYIRPINRAMILFMKRFFNPLFQNSFIFNLSPSGWENRAHMTKIHKFIRQIISERRKELERSLREQAIDVQQIEDIHDVGVMTKKRYAFLDSLLVTHLQNPDVFTESDIHDEVNTFMFGGHDTTSVALYFTLLLIADDDRVQDKVYQELAQVLEGRIGSITIEDCRQMKYLEMCIKESLRLYPPVPAIMRTIEHDFVVRGHQIPAGVTASIHFILLHRDPQVFPQPERFIPERFEPGASVHKMPYAYMPFSAGPRNCIGQKYALLEMKIVLATLLQRYHLTAVTKRDQVDVAIAVLLKAQSPVVIRFEKRTELKH